MICRITLRPASGCVKSTTADADALVLGGADVGGVVGDDDGVVQPARAATAATLTTSARAIVRVTLQSVQPGCAVPPE